MTGPCHPLSVLRRSLADDEPESFRRALRHEQERLRRSHEHLERYARALERSNTKLRQFAYAASHDLQEPLRTVTGFVQLLARRYRGQLDSDADDFIDFAVDGARRMQQLIDDLLAYAQLQQPNPAPLEVDVAILLAQVKANLRQQIEERGAVLRWGKMPKVLAEPTRLLQVFQNLIANAIKFSRSEVVAEVVVLAERRETDWVFAISDNGLGIEADHHERIFGMFQRLNDRRRYAGTGIGLPICKEIVEQHSGHIWVESQPGEGSSFFFSLPFEPPRELPGQEKL